MFWTPYTESYLSIAGLGKIQIMVIHKWLSSSTRASISPDPILFYFSINLISLPPSFLPTYLLFSSLSFLLFSFFSFLFSSAIKRVCCPSFQRCLKKRGAGKRLTHFSISRLPRWTAHGRGHAVFSLPPSKAFSPPPPGWQCPHGRSQDSTRWSPPSFYACKTSIGAGNSLDWGSWTRHPYRQPHGIKS